MNPTKTTEEQIKEVINSINMMVEEAKEEMQLFADSEVMFLKWLKENKFNIYSNIATDGKCVVFIQTNSCLNELNNRGYYSKYVSHLYKLIGKYFSNGKIKAIINEKLGEDPDEIVFTNVLFVI